MYGSYVTLGILVLCGFIGTGQGQGFDPRRCRQPVDLCFLTDMSGSIGRQDWLKVLDFVIGIINPLEINSDWARVGLGSFSDNSYLNIGLGESYNKEELRRMIRNIVRYAGRTNTAEGLRQISENCFQSPMDRPDVINIAVILTDGNANVNRGRLPEAIRQLHIQAKEVKAIGIGDIDDRALQALAKRGDNQPPREDQDWFPRISPDELQNLLITIIPTICEALPTLPPTEPPPTPCRQVADVCFILDNSASVGESGWRMSRDFVINILQYFEVSHSMTRVGVVTFGTNAQNVIQLGQFPDRRTLRNEINRIPYVGDTSTNTAAGLNLAANGCFRSPNDRQEVDNIAFVLTDGIPTERPEDVPQARNNLHTAASRVAVIGVGLEKLIPALRDIAKAGPNMGPPESNRDFFNSPSFADLQALVNRISPMLCDLNPTPGPTPPPLSRSCVEKLDLCLVMDRSVSITRDGWNTIVEFATNVIERLFISPDFVQVAVVTFAGRNDVRLDVRMGTLSDNRGLVDAIRRIQYDGRDNGFSQSDIPGALSFATSQCFNPDRPDVNDVVLFFSDGQRRDNRPIDQEIRDLKEKAEIITVIGIGTLNIDTLSSISKSPNGPSRQNVDLILRPQRVNIPDLVDGILGRVCRAQPQCRFPVDLCLVLDSSESLQNDGWAATQAFATRVVQNLRIANDQARVGLITFSDEAILRIAIGDRDNILDLVQAINNLEYIRGLTNTPAALSLAAAAGNCFSQDRPNNVPKVALVITDGIRTIGTDADELAAIRELHETADVVATIGVGREEKELPNLERIAKTDKNIRIPQRGQDYFITPDFDSLQDLLENIIPRICPPAPCVSQADVCLILDSSYSVGTDGWSLVKQFAVNMANQFAVSATQVHIGVVTFSDQARVAIPLGAGTSNADLATRINDLPYIGGDTNTYAALATTADHCFSAQDDRPGVDNFALFLSDGIPTIEADRLDEGISKLHPKTKGVASIGIGMEPNIDRDILRRIAKSDLGVVQLDRDFFITPDFRALQELVERITPQICPTPRPTPPPMCQRQLDVCFILDSSDSVGERGWQMNKDVTKQIATQFLANVNTRVGVITYSRTAGLEIPLGGYSSTEDLFSQVDRLQYKRGWTDTSAALELAAAQYFDTNMDRFYFQNIVIIITDGQPTIGQESLNRAISRVHAKTDLVVAVGVTDDIDVNTLRDISKARLDGHPLLAQDYFRAGNYNELNGLVDAIAQLVCGVAPTLPPAKICQQDADICFILDRSGSETSDGWRRVQDAVKGILRENAFLFDTPPRYGIVTFSDHPFLSVDLGAFDINYLERQVEEITYFDGWTNIGHTLSLTANGCFNSRGDRPNAKNIGVFIGDGVATVYHEDIVTGTRDLHRVTDCVISVGIGVNISDTSLRNISKTGQSARIPQRGKDFFRETGVLDVGSISARLLECLCSNPGRAFVPFVPELGPAPIIALPVPRPRPGLPCSDAIDVCLVLDSTKSLTTMGWLYSLQFAQGVVQELKKLSSSASLGIVLYGKNASLETPLTDTNKGTLMDIISKFDHLDEDGATTVETLNLTATACFDLNYHRPFVPSAVIYVTSGTDVTAVNNIEVDNSILLLKSKTSTIVPVGIVRRGNQLGNYHTLLGNIAETYSGRQPKQNKDYFLIGESADLPKMAGKIVRNLCPDL